MKRHRQVISAGWRNLRYRWRFGIPWLDDTLAMLRRILTLGRHRTTKPDVWRRRVRICRACDIYDPVHRTCGDNRRLIQFEKGDEIVCAPGGCGCLVGVKSSYPDEDCFLASIGLQSKWRFQNFRVDGRGNTTQPLPTKNDESR